jgi:hypothetical protein
MKPVFCCEIVVGQGECCCRHRKGRLWSGAGSLRCFSRYSANIDWVLGDYCFVSVIRCGVCWLEWRSLPRFRNAFGFYGCIIAPKVCSTSEVVLS